METEEDLIAHLKETLKKPKVFYDVFNWILEEVAAIEQHASSGEERKSNIADLVKKIIQHREDVSQRLVKIYSANKGDDRRFFYELFVTLIELVDYSYEMHRKKIHFLNLMPFIIEKLQSSRGKWLDPMSRFVAGKI